MNAIEELIGQAEEVIRQGEERRSEIARQELESKLEKEAEMRRYLAEKLGPAYDELQQYVSDEDCDGYWLHQNYHVAVMEMNLFSLSTNGHSITYRSGAQGNSEIRDAKDFGYRLAENRREFRRKFGLIEQCEPYRQALQAFVIERDAVIAENQRRLAAAQRDVPRFKVYDLTYAINERNGMTKHFAVLQCTRSKTDVYTVVQEGGIYNEKIYNPVSLNVEDINVVSSQQGASELQDRFGYEVLGCYVTEYGPFYYGPNILVDEFIPEFLALPVEPEPPEGLGRDQVGGIRWDLGLPDSLPF